MKRAISEDHSDFIIAQLNSIARPYKRQDRFNIYTLCANPAHLDKSPSMSIRIDGSMVNCWSCGFHGSWNKVAHLLNLKKLTNDPYEKNHVYELELELQAIEQGSVDPLKGVALPPLSENWEGPFKIFSKELMTKLKTQTWYDFRPNGLSVERILWPFYQEGKLVGGTGRILPKYEPEDPKDLKKFYKTHPKYRNLPGISAKNILFPYDFIEPSNVVILAEGPTSALRLLDEGLPALGILGSNNWSNHKISLLLKKGVKHIITAFDGDAAGKTVTDNVVNDVKDFMDVYPLQLPQGQDPYSLDRSWIDFLVKEVNLLK